ncbi:MAG: hemolysin family protein [Planctomycetes bacterium]|jgi:putative hemolysin|nr:hemolysin family protein [Planctomycetota bacterium]
MTVFLVSVLVALLVSALCSLLEATLLSLSSSQIASIAVKRPGTAAIWRRFKADIEKPIAAILVLNTAAHTIGASVAGAEFDELFGQKWIWAFSLIFTFLMLQFTEILPKGVGVRHNRQVARWLGPWLVLLIRAMRPVVALVHGVNWLFGWRRSPAVPAATLEEITALAGLARLTKEIGPDQERIIRRATALSEICVGEIMRPRVEIDTLDIDAPPDEVLARVAMSGFARVPVCEGDLDHIVGFIYNKDLLRRKHMGLPIDVRKMLHPALMVPETLRLDQLFDRFRERRIQLAIVLDEYGGTKGLVTVEDALEELVGAIPDEHREQQDEIVRRDDRSVLVDGTTHLRDLVEALGRPQLAPMAPQEVSTVGGLIQRILDRVPAVGDRVVWFDLSLEVAAMDGRRIDRAIVSREPPPAACE